MLINLIILAVSSSIDSLGIGITYGIKNTSISKLGKIILFVVSFLVTMFALFFGNVITSILPQHFMPIVGCSILIFIGFLVLFQSLKEDNVSFDFDSSNLIDSKEALFLAFALSLDSFCIGVGSTIIGINNIFFPFFIASFQWLFLSLGIFLGKRLNKKSHFPKNIWSIISGTLLIFIGIIKLI